MQNIKIEYIDVDSLELYQNNSKLHPKEQIEQIKASIKKFGFNDPIGIKGNIVVTGNGRLIAIKEMGYKKVPIIRLDHLNEAEMKAYVIAHNKLTMNSGFDEELLKIELEELKNLDFDLELTGFSNEELDNLDLDLDFNNLADESKADEVPKEVQESFIKYRDVIELGNHRLICGDSTNKDDIETLMNGEKADICFTDPDYAMDDDKWIDCILNIGLKDGNPFFIMASDKQQVRYVNKIPNFRKFFAGIRNQALMISQYVPMNKLTLVSYFGERPSEFFVNKKDHFTDVFEFKRNASNNEEKEGHRHYKSVEVPIHFIEHYSRIGNLVIDPFAGSGTTLIANDMLGMRCNTCEIEPINCELVIERYCNYTNNYEITVNGEKGDLEYFRKKITNK